MDANHTTALNRVLTVLGIIIRDLIGIGAIGSIVYGISLWSVPSAFIAAGVLLLMVVVLMSRSP
jgi:hypothetical protein